MKTELGLSIAAPTVSQADVDRVREMLAGIGWQRGANLCGALGIDDRTLRAIAEASDGAIISGQQGYRHFDRSTPIGEADRAASWLESQARKMILRASSIRRRIHRYAREQVAA